MSDTPTTPEQEPEHIRDLRARAEAAPAAEARAAAAEREMAFLRAGVNTGNAFGRMVMSEHQGELTTEAIAETVTRVQGELGMPGEAKPPEPGAPGTPEAALQAAREGLTSGAPALPEEPKPKSTEDRAWDTMAAARKAGMNEDEAREAAMGEYFRGAANGDTAVIYNEEEWLARAALHGHGADLASMPLSVGDRDHPQFVPNPAEGQPR